MRGRRGPFAVVVAVLVLQAVLVAPGARAVQGHPGWQSGPAVSVVSKVSQSRAKTTLRLRVRGASSVKVTYMTQRTRTSKQVKRVRIVKVPRRTGSLRVGLAASTVSIRVWAKGYRSRIVWRGKPLTWPAAPARSDEDPAADPAGDDEEVEEPLPPLPWEDRDRLVAEIVRATNRARAAGGTCGPSGSEVFPPSGPVTLNPTLTAVAQAYQDDMIARRYVGHVGLDYSWPWDRAARGGYPMGWANENLQAWYSSNYDWRVGRMESVEAFAEAAVQGWLDSWGHCENVRDPDWTEIGVGSGFGQYPDEQMMCDSKKRFFYPNPHTCSFPEDYDPDFWEGRMAWQGVQLFGRPESAGPPTPPGERPDGQDLCCTVRR